MTKEEQLSILLEHLLDAEEALRKAQKAAQWSCWDDALEEALEDIKSYVHEVAMAKVRLWVKKDA